MTLAGRYAEFAARLAWETLPARVRALAQDLFIDWLANAAAGLFTPLGQALAELAGACPEGRAYLVGDWRPARPLDAALVNAGAAHGLEFDDSHRAGLYHPGAPTFAAALAAAQEAGAGGADLLCGAVAGYEVALRIALAVNPAHYRLFHTTGTVGAFGAAAAAARALRLDPAATAHALGLAGTQAAGLWEVLPSAPAAKNLHPAKAAHAGLLAALLARRGIAGPAGILEGPRGFFAALAPEPVDLARCLAGLGEDWLILTTTTKVYPVCGHTMTAIEAGLELHRQLAGAGIVEVTARVHPVAARIAGNPDPRDEYQAKFSIPYCLAAALLYGRVGQAEFGGQVLRAPALRDLLSRVRLTVDESLAADPDRRPAEVALRLADGRTLSARAEVRKGDPETPLTPAERRDKFLSLAGQAWGREPAGLVLAALAGLPGAGSLNARLARCRELAAAG